MLIREATGEDWPAIWPFLHEIVAAGETYALPRDLGEQAARELWLPAPPWCTAVIVNDFGDILGSVKMGPNREGPGSHIATASFMVAPASAGQGAGRALGTHMLSWARTEGYRGVQFNAVVETNTRAVALWKSLGFTVIGTVPEAFHHPVHGYVGLHVMHQPIS
ncbi:GNAT family N-acetyltransferase [Amycolatopsis rhabdoformis]|uniref:GNAT family N-acetyltransferase n=1 Tax=Amycolatopsis rhabdoformis TaxID=1448059 RepID=A0ABZ1I562_9PSEU|nr:GNAT family N-acetyltransferase [Amycolatopsis rhabdoformis]WSE29420.1 GNAT family N-acetyltransferase [Amycolatopsis rhabdoformis]